MKNRSLMGVAVAGALMSPLAAQTPGIRVEGPVHDRIMIHRYLPAPGMQPHSTVEFIATEMAFEGGVVKGMPFSAEGVNEFTQTLADGNRITRKNSSAIYRDSEGRTRRETGLPPLAVFGGAAEPQSTVVIMDPVANATYILDTKNKTARKLPSFMRSAAPGNFELQASEGEGKTRVMTFSRRIDVTGPVSGEAVAAAGAVAAVPGAIAFRSAGSSDQMKTEDLGKQTVEGVLAEGTRTTTTIPAGSIGNDREIKVVHERWFSPDLKQVVLSKHSDPRMGETTYRLTRIQRAEPARALFEVPADYTLKTAPEPNIRILRKDGPGAPEVEVPRVRATQKL
jgi:hypothetical protein